MGCLDKSKRVFVCVILFCSVLWLSPANLFGAERVIGAASSMVNFFPKTPPAAGEIASEIMLSAARGESESAQVVVVAGASALDIQRVEVSDLRQGAARINKDNITVHLVGYVDIKEKENSWHGIRQPGLWPDPLLIFRPFTCPAGETRSMWVTVKVPRQAAPGGYEGDVRLYSGGSLVASVPIRLKVWSFSLPEAPKFRAIYWTHVGDFYDLTAGPESFIQNIKLFGDYRISTDLWPVWNFRDPGNMRKWVVLWYLEEDGTMTCDISGMQRTIELAVEAGFGTLQIGHGCWMGSEFDDMSLIDRQTGRLLLSGSEEWKSALGRIKETLNTEQKDGFPGTYFARLFLPQMCNWLESKGLLERSYMQLYDEAVDPAALPGIASLYNRYRHVEPRLKLLGLTGVTPEMQGAFDIWAPFQQFYDPGTYDMVRKGISLYGPKNFRAAVTASSNGLGRNAGGSQRDYLPVDGYDGCDYTKWTPAANPSAETPQWLRFDFDGPQQIDGIRITPFPYLPWDSQPMDSVWFVEASEDGQDFEPLKLAKRAGIEGACSFPLKRYKAMRLTHAKMGSKFAPTSSQDVLALNTASNMRRPDGSSYVMVGEGVREVEFLREGLPLESALPREKVRPAEMWEYQVGAGYPSATIDADPSEIRATGWQSWARGLVGWLNYGGGQWQSGGKAENQTRSKTEDRLVWEVPGGSGRGSPWIVYPGQKEVLPSVRLARFRDGADDYDYLTMLSEKQPDHPVLKQSRDGESRPYAWTGRWAANGSEPYSNTESMLKARAAVAEVLDKLYARPGVK